jgi:GntR family transcriptional regulator/MocR family aminotransferase
VATDDILWRQLLVLSRRTDLTLQRQLRSAIARAILDRRLPLGTLLPSSRRLAEILGISRNTVTLAFDQLARDGFLTARSRSGYLVDPSALENAARADATRLAPPERRPDWTTRLLSRPSRARHVTKPVDWFNYRFPFVYGQPDPALFPMAEWREVVQLSLRAAAVRDWAGDHVDADDPLLIEQLQKRVLPRRGVWVSPEQILVTLGAQQALYLAAALLLGPGKTVAVEQPGYPDIRNLCRQLGAHILPLPMDEHGLQVNASLAECDALFVQPSHQNPTTVTMPLDRRQELLRAASLHDLVIVEDDYDSELTFVGEATAALKALDRDERVIYVGSVSKTLAPGLRLGFMVGAPEFISEARALRRLTARHPPTNNQRALGLFLQLGYHDAAIKRLIAAYRERVTVIGEGLRAYLPDFIFRPPAGGSALWATGPADLSMNAVAAKAAPQGLLFDPGAAFFDHPAPPDNHLRLGYSAIPLDRIAPGIELLGQLVRQAKAQWRGTNRMSDGAAIPSRSSGPRDGRGGYYEE